MRMPYTWSANLIGPVFSAARIYSHLGATPHPDPEHQEEWVYDTTPTIVPGKNVDLVDGTTVSIKAPRGWRLKTIEEKEMEAAMKEVDEIAPGWKE